MNLLLSTTLLLTLLTTNLLGPGLLVVRRLPLSPLEKCGFGIATGLFVTYLWGLIGFLFSFPTAFHYTGSLLALFPVYRCRHDALEIATHPQVKQMLSQLVALIAWCAVLSTVIISFSGGGWELDWALHYEKSLCFARLQPLLPEMNCWYPGRPPLANFVAAHLFIQIGPGFYLYQVLSIALASLIFVSAYIFLSALPGTTNKSLQYLLLLFCLTPSLVQNITYTWTKLPSAFFIVLAIHFFFRSSWFKNHFFSMLVFICLSWAMITHYSAGPYAVFFTAVYCILFVWRGTSQWRNTTSPALPAETSTLRRRSSFRDLMIIAATNTSILATWFIPAAIIYGKSTFAATSTYEGFEAQSWNQAIRTIVNNVWVTLAPSSIVPTVGPEAPMTTIAAQYRDFFFHLYQGNAFLSLGVAAAAVLPFAGLRLYRDPAVSKRALLFCLAFFTFINIAGLIVVSLRSYTGLAHICLLSITVMGTVIVARELGFWSPRARRLLFLAVAADAVCGIFLHFYVQSLAFHHLPPMADLFGSAASNYSFKQSTGIKFLADVLTVSPALRTSAIGVGFGLISYYWFRIARD